jgi:hypothetical protein
MFVAMETELLTFKEKMDLLPKGKSLLVENINTVYSIIARHFPKECGKKFSIRTHPTSGEKRLFRIK